MESLNSMEQTLQCLWMEVDRADDPDQQAQSVQVLADCYEERGQPDHAEVLRTFARRRRNTPDTMPVWQDVPKLVDAMSLRSVRLFACACVERSLSAESTREREVLRVVRRYEFGMATRENLVAQQEWAYRHWEKSGPNSWLQAEDQMDATICWGLVRASGMVSRVRLLKNIRPDATFAAKNTQRRRRPAEARGVVCQRTGASSP